MIRTVAFYVFVCFLTGALSCRKANDEMEQAISRSVEWLWQQQSDDGGWHSNTHAVLRDGIVLTPYILYNLVQNPSYCQGKEKQIDAAVAFISHSLRGDDREEKIALEHYPVYSAAYALRVLHALKTETDLQQSIADYLYRQQFCEQRGFSKDSLVYGGWGFGEPDLKTGRHGHVDISHTRRVLEALHETSLQREASDEAALYFIKSVQRDTSDHRLYAGCHDRTQIPFDGGFISSSVTLGTNKSTVITSAGGDHYPSYATSTCDGFMALHALGLHQSSSYQDAKDWLLKNRSITTVEGLTQNHSDQWSDIMHYYHLAVRAEVMSIIDPDGQWREDVKKTFIREQSPSGYFINPLGGVNKEDDPLMATIFCLQAIGASIGLP